MSGSRRPMTTTKPKGRGRGRNNKRGRDKRKRSPRPKTAGLLLEQHPLFEEVVSLLRERWTGASIRVNLNERYRSDFATHGGKMPPLPVARTIDRYADLHREKIAPTVPGPDAAIEGRPLTVHTQIDLLRSLEKLYNAAEARLERALAFESEAKDKDAPPLKAVDDAAATLDRIAARLVDIQMKLGIFNPFREGDLTDLRQIKAVVWEKNTKFTEARRNHILTLVAEGNFRSTAALAAGITGAALYNWMKKGEEDLEAEKRTEYSLFLIHMGVADSMAETAALRNIRRAGVTDWRAEAWLLERTRPEKFGRTDWLHVGVMDAVSHVGERLGMDADEQALVARHTEELLRGKRAALPEGKG